MNSVRPEVLVASLVLSAAAMLAGCGETPSDSAANSEGVTIVRNVLPAPERWSLDSVPIAMIGRTGSPERVGQVVGMEILSNGNVLVADEALTSVRLFDRTGALVRTVVREGDGPQELRSVNGLFRTTSDTMYVYDGNARTLLVLDPFANPVRKVSDIDFTAVATDEEGRLWTLSPVAATYSELTLALFVFDDTGPLVAEVAMHGYFRLFAVRDSLVAGAVVRDLGEEHIELRLLRRR